MVLPLESYLFSVLVFLLEKLVYFENWWYEVIWSHWRPSSTTTLDKLVKRKEDEIWHAVIFGKDGQVRRIFEDLTNKPEARLTFPNVTGNGVAAFSPSSSPRDTEAGAPSYRPDTKLQEAVEIDVKEHGVFDRDENREMAVQARLEAIAERLANSSRSLTKKEKEQAQKWWSSGSFSLLWMAIHQDHKSDVDYLLTEHNQKLHKGNGSSNETVLHLAVSKNDLDLVRDILEKSSYTSPHTYINARDSGSRTALHNLVSSLCLPYAYHSPGDLSKAFDILDLLSQHGANIDALDMGFRTPLHTLLSRTLSRKRFWPEELSTIPLDRLMDKLLQAGTEVNTKDFQGDTPLHIACELRNMDAIAKLVRNGADLGSLNRDGKTPKRVFSDGQGLDEDFWKRMVILSRRKRSTDTDLFALSNRLSSRRDRNSKAAIAVCQRSAVYCRYQWSGLASNNSNPPHWAATDKYVSHILFSDKRSEGIPFLAECEEECALAWQDLIEPLGKEGKENEHDTAGGATDVDNSAKVAKYTWRWLNFPENNVRYCHMTWIRDFVEDNLSISNIARRFFDDHMEVRNTRNKGHLIRVPHAHIMSQGASKAYDPVENTGTPTRSMVSLVIPFIDIEVENSYGSTSTPGEEAYPPFNGINGVQMPQTLDQTSINTDSRSELRCKENQVIYRWSKKQDSGQEKRLPLEWMVRNPFSSLARLLRKVRRHLESCDNKESAISPLDRTGRAMGDERAGISTEMQRILKDRRPKWLMVRQLWLWKFNDGTILSAIPSRTNVCMANDLLETIRQSGLNGVYGSDDLVNHILQETITFPDKFLRAGLGEHILDVFESEIAAEADEEATFYNNFAHNDWNSKHANRAISCTWRVKDIRDELQLIRNVFDSQLKVVKQFAKVIEEQPIQTPEDSNFIPSLKSKLEGMMQRIDSMDSEANKTTESLSNITQAMLAQAALKEAESARLMNFIILPFTIVTVIFTPLSFMTSLFAVNSDGFPHNEDGELRIPSDWFWRRMVFQ
ncbi:hypothetical protein FPRO06_02076 [Fusarium proliferatum]|nr:hypothetical protein FPRO06_02076 [Fusarium proliferatum]